MDKLIVKGLGKPLDGEYEFDLGDILGIGTPGALTNREAHRLKVMSGVRIGELEDALSAGDTDVFVALGAIILTRQGVSVDEDKLWDAPVGSGLDFDLAKTEETDEEEDPPGQPARLPVTPPSPSGGPSSSSTSDNQESDPSPTGHPDSEKSSDSVRLTSVI